MLMEISNRRGCRYILTAVRLLIYGLDDFNVNLHILKTLFQLEDINLFLINATKELEFVLRRNSGAD